MNNDKVQFVSIGNACNVKHQLDKYLESKDELQETLFFDWLLSDMNSVTELLLHGDTHLQVHQLMINSKPRRFNNSNIVFKSLSYCESLHDLPVDYTQSDVEEFLKKYRRRLDRILMRIKSRNPLVFIRYGSVTREEEDQFKHAVKSLNNDCRFNLVSLMNGEAMVNDLEFVRSLGSKQAEETRQHFFSLDLAKYKVNSMKDWETSCYDWNKLFSLMETSFKDILVPTTEDQLVIGIIHDKLCTKTMDMLTRFLKQTVNKQNVHVVLLSKVEVPEFVTFLLLNQREYASVTHFEGDQLYEHILDVAIKKQCSMMIMQTNHMLEPHTIQTLLDSKDKGVIAPMLTSRTRYSNYHTKVDNNGYCVDEPFYDDLLYKRVKGQIAVPVVNGMYFVHHKFLSQILYNDGTKREPYVIMSDNLRKKEIPQYLDNRQNYGIIS